MGKSTNLLSVQSGLRNLLTSKESSQAVSGKDNSRIHGELQARDINLGNCQ